MSITEFFIELKEACDDTRIQNAKLEAERKQKYGRR
jgi:hypothetical protein